MPSRPDPAASRNGHASLSGEVAAMIFVNESSGFGVVELAGAGEADGARASGPLAGLVPGQPVRLLGRWTEHDRYGPTFSAVAYELERPQSTAGLRAFLASDRFPGVGDKIAARLVQRFGVDGLGDVIEQDPQQLTMVKGVSAALAHRIEEGWREAGALADLVRTLSEAGLSASAAQAVHRRFGEAAAQIVADDPYRLLDVRGVGWAQVESLARAAGIDKLDDRRLAAGAVVSHRQRAARHGHVALPDGDLVAEVVRVCKVDPLQARKGLEIAARRGRLVADDAGPGEEVLWYTPADLAAERGLAEAIARLRSARSRLRGAAREYEPDPELTAEQAAAVRGALTSPVSVLTGGPGTGKTRTLLEVVRVAGEAGLTIALCAPTGRAARRMEEVTRHGASTVHRLLEARPGGDDEGFTFGYDDDRRLPHDLVIADEWSMADVRLAWALARAVDDGSHLMLVGDVDQLPSVGSGAVLRDLLSPEVSGGEDPVVAATRLTTVHRQAAASRIVTLAHQINEGRVPPLSGRDGDVFVVPEHPLRVVERVAEIVAVRAPDFYGCAPSDVQVLAPMYKGPAGVDALNEGLKERLNPPAGRRAVRGFHEGDRVVATRNDAELDVANGDIGEVVESDPDARTLTVAFPHGIVEYPADKTEDLDPAWCLTVHKSQGGEWPVVILVLDASQRVMLWRELVYTAVTRAARGLLLVGDASLVGQAAQRTGSGARQRRTRLADRVSAAVVQERLTLHSPVPMDTAAATDHGMDADGTDGLRPPPAA